jgi:hypothetical protein
MAIKKLTPALLRQIVKEERSRIMAEAKKKKMKETDEISSDTEEVDADGFAKTLTKQTDFAKAAGIKNEAATLEELVVLERRLARLQKKIQESKAASRRKIVRAAR